MRMDSESQVDDLEMFVYKVPPLLFAVLLQMEKEYKQFDSTFGREILQCVQYFYEMSKDGWRRVEQEDVDVLRIISRDIIGRLAKAKTVLEASVGEWSEAIRADFDRIERYVRLWLGRELENQNRDLEQAQAEKVKEIESLKHEVQRLKAQVEQKCDLVQTQAEKDKEIATLKKELQRLQALAELPFRYR